MLRPTASLFRLPVGYCIISRMMLRDRPFPEKDLPLDESVLGFLQFVHTTAVNKLPVRGDRLLVDVLQESARHLGHLDILRELIDGAKGE